jgi:Tfp pilus assembly protein PilX
MIKSNDKGYILITVLLLLLVLTIVGMSAINTSTVENMLSGNIRLRETNFSMADAGIELSTAVIERAVTAQDVQGFSNIVDDPTLPTELRSTAFDPDANTDVSYSSDNHSVDVDIDKMYNIWGNDAIEFAAGYEGLGKGGASGFKVFYRINASSSGLASSEAEVGSIYQYIPK